MCFFAEPFGGTLTRGEALAAIAGIAAVPIMPSQSWTPHARQRDEGAGSPRSSDDGAVRRRTPLPNATILIAGNRIEAVGAADAVTIPDSALHRCIRIRQPPDSSTATSISSRAAAFTRAPMRSTCDRSARTPNSEWIRITCSILLHGICAPESPRSWTSAALSGTTTYARSRNARRRARE